MDENFIMYRFKFSTKKTPFTCEILNTIFEYVKQNDLQLPNYFDRNHWNCRVYTKNDSIVGYFQETVVNFLARPKTKDEILRDQIEFQISHL